MLPGKFWKTIHVAQLLLMYRFCSVDSTAESLYQQTAAFTQQLWMVCRNPVRAKAQWAMHRMLSIKRQVLQLVRTSKGQQLQHQTLRKLSSRVQLKAQAVICPPLPASLVLYPSSNSFPSLSKRLPNQAPTHLLHTHSLPSRLFKGPTGSLHCHRVWGWSQAVPIHNKWQRLTLPPQ